MSNKETNPGAAAPEQPDPLSATGMFLRSMEAQGESKVPDPLAPAAGRVPESNAPTAGAQAPGPGGAPGEFTQFFETLKRGQQGAAPAPAPAPTAPAPTPSSGGNAAPGEFTRIFTGAENAAAKNAADTQRSTPPTPPPSRAKGF